MAMTLNETPSANRLHIGVFGRTNSGKSSLSMRLPVRRSPSWQMSRERLRTRSISRWKSIRSVHVSSSTRPDLTIPPSLESAVWKNTSCGRKDGAWNHPFAGEEMEEELHWYRFLKERSVPVLSVVNKADILENPGALVERIEKKPGKNRFYSVRRPKRAWDR